MNFTRGRIIGHGASAAVSIAYSCLTGDVFAVKSAELFCSESLQREQKILSNLNCSHIVSYRGSEISIENGKAIFNLMMEYAADGTMADRLSGGGGRLDEPTTGYYTRQIVKGLEYLHSRGIVHCDIKGSNILLSKGEVKIADFGCAKTAAEEAAVIGGTPMFMAPEVVRGEEQGFAADIWALGCTLIEMLSGESPWPSERTTLHRIAFSGESPRFPAVLSEVARDFLSKCLMVDPRERWTAKELLKHPFLDEFRCGEKITESADSPTSVLDRGIWGEIEEEFLQDRSELNFAEFLDDPVERMKELFRDSRRENWDWRESWIIVRDSRGRCR